MQITYLGKGELKYLPWSTYDQETLIGRDKASYRSPRLKKITRNFLDISVIVLKEEHKAFFYRKKVVWMGVPVSYLDYETERTVITSPFQVICVSFVMLFLLF